VTRYIQTKKEQKMDNSTMVHEMVSCIQAEYAKVGKTPPPPNLLTQGIEAYTKRHAFAIWGVEDFIDHAAREGYPMNEEVALDLLNALEEDQDCNYGITWDHLTNLIQKWHEDQKWEEMSLETLSSFGSASFIIRTGNENFKYFPFVNVEFQDCRVEAQKFFDNGVPVCVVCVPYGEYLDVDPHDLTYDLLEEKFLEGHTLFLSTYFEKVVPS
jgi:hypothetical protein